MNGGPDGYCVSEAEIDAILRTSGRPCPRVELPPGLTREAELLGFLTHDTLKPLARPFLEATVEAEDVPPDEVVEIIRRVKGTLNHPDVILRMKPAPADPATPPPAAAPADPVAAAHAIAAAQRRRERS